MRISDWSSDVCSSDLCDVTIDVALPANRDAAPAITRLRESLIAEHLGVETADVTREFARTGSLIATIEVLQGDGRTLELLDLVSPGPLDEFIASNELLDPTSPDEIGRESCRERVCQYV